MNADNKYRLYEPHSLHVLNNKIRRPTAINQRGALNQFSRSRKIDGSYELVSVSAWQCRARGLHTSGRKAVDGIPCKLGVDTGFDQKIKR